MQNLYSTLFITALLVAARAQAAIEGPITLGKDEAAATSIESTTNSQKTHKHKNRSHSDTRIISGTSATPDTGETGTPGYGTGSGAAGNPEASGGK